MKSLYPFEWSWSTKLTDFSSGMLALLINNKSASESELRVSCCYSLLSLSFSPDFRINMRWDKAISICYTLWHWKFEDTIFEENAGKRQSTLTYERNYCCGEWQVQADSIQTSYYKILVLPLYTTLKIRRIHNFRYQIFTQLIFKQSEKRVIQFECTVKWLPPQCMLLLWS